MPCEEKSTFRGKVSETVDKGKIEYIAAAPAHKHMSVSGSGLPHASRAQAFDGTPNRGVVDVKLDGSFEIELFAPGAFYDDYCGTYVPPTLFFWYTSNGVPKAHQVAIANGIPFRALTYDKRRTSPLFYLNKNLQVRGQEQLLRESAYPCVNQVPDNFWGKAVPPG